MDTLTKAKKTLRDNFERGTDCPCCGQYVKLYRRPINAGMAIFLIELYKLGTETGREYHHARDVLKRVKSATTSRDYCILEHYKLIERRGDSEDGKRTSGYWRVTGDGKDFAVDNLLVPRRVHLYNNKKVGFDEDLVSISDLAGAVFDYEELMGDYMVFGKATRVLPTGGQKSLF